MQRDALIKAIKATRGDILVDIHNADDSHAVKAVKSDLIAMLNHHWKENIETGYAIHAVNDTTYFGIDYTTQ